MRGSIRGHNTARGWSPAGVVVGGVDAWAVLVEDAQKEACRLGEFSVFVCTCVRVSNVVLILYCVCTTVQDAYTPHPVSTTHHHHLYTCSSSTIHSRHREPTTRPPIGGGP